MRLIDADKMCENLATVDREYETMIDWVIRVTKAQPTVDAVPVVRCKDCKHAGRVHEYLFCQSGNTHGYAVNENDFCSQGKKVME